MVGQLFGLLPVAIYICDSSRLIIYYNSRAAELWGQSPSLNDRQIVSAAHTACTISTVAQ
jgi:PAS domain-containing protein